MIELKEVPMCCGKPMEHETNCQNMIYSQEAEIQSWTCKDCGRFITVIEDQLDEEELDALDDK